MQLIANKQINIKKNSTLHSVTVITNIFGYFCKNGERQILETKVKKRFFNRSLIKKKTINLSHCLTTIIQKTTPYIKLKQKKNRRRTTKKQFFVRPIDRITSKRKAYISFSSFFKSIKRTKKPFVSQLEIQLESIYTQRKNRNQKHILTDKQNLLHKSAFKFKRNLIKNKRKFKDHKSKFKINLLF